MIRYSDPFMRSIPLHRVLDRMIDDMVQASAAQDQDGAGRTPQAQTIPVNVFQTPEQLVVVAPMPGISPDDIEVNVTIDSVHLKADYRGPHQEGMDYLIREWSYGPYERVIRLPAGVDAERTNASFNNGVLVLNLPKRDVTRSHRIRLQGQNTSHGSQEVRSGRATLDGSGSSRAAAPGEPGSPAANAPEEPRPRDASDSTAGATKAPAAASGRATKKAPQ